MTTYRVEPYDHDDGPGLWRYESEHDQEPVPVAYLFNGHLACGEADHGVVFRAAAAVLAPDQNVVDMIAAWASNQDPAAGMDVWREEALELLDGLREYVEEATP